jgi:tRNA(adenine34) deaminase
MEPNQWETYMSKALELAREAAELGEIPVGALVVRDGEILGQGYNRRESDHDATAHAEILAIREACRKLGGWRLEGCTLVVTLELCPMCTGAILQSRLDRVIFGAFDPKAGCCGGLLSLTEEPFDTHPALYGGVLEQECLAVLQQFFAARRRS